MVCFSSEMLSVRTQDLLQLCLSDANHDIHTQKKVYTMLPSLCHHVVMKTPHINGEIALTLVYNSNHHHLVHVPVVPDFIQFYRTERTMGSPVCGVWG